MKDLPLKLLTTIVDAHVYKLIRSSLVIQLIEITDTNFLMLELLVRVGLHYKWLPIVVAILL